MFGQSICTSICRGMVITILSPILRHTGYGMSWKEGIVMTWGGLRGAVSLALALQVAHHDTIDQEGVGVRVSTYSVHVLQGIVMTWGGLRGAVILALALQVAHHDTIDQEGVGVRVGTYSVQVVIKHIFILTLENTEGTIKKIDNPERLATCGTHDKGRK